VKEKKKTPDAERRTPNIEFRSSSDLDVGRWALGVERLPFYQLS